MDTGKNRSIVVMAVVAGITLLFGCCLGVMAGGAAGYVFGQRAARAVTVTRFQRVTPAPFVPAPRATPRAAQPTPGVGQTPQAAPSQGTSGVLVQEVVAGSPAETAGLRPGDVITQLDNTRLDASHTLSDLVAQHQPGDQVKLTVLRGAQSQAIPVTLGERVDNSGMAYLGVRFVDTTVTPQPTP